MLSSRLQSQCAHRTVFSEPACGPQLLLSVLRNLNNISENTAAAESRIRDTDIAGEMVVYSNDQILMQAGASMLAQANQHSQMILSLLG